jgi:hypothetical protein
MKAKINSKKQITFTGISNESQLESVQMSALNSNCKCTMSEFSMKAVVTGSEDEIKKFIKLYNAA